MDATAKRRRRTRYKRESFVEDGVTYMGTVEKDPVTGEDMILLDTPYRRETIKRGTEVEKDAEKEEEEAPRRGSFTEDGVTYNYIAEKDPVTGEETFYIDSVDNKARGREQLPGD